MHTLHLLILRREEGGRPMHGLVVGHEVKVGRYPYHLGQDRVRLLLEVGLILPHEVGVRRAGAEELRVERCQIIQQHLLEGHQLARVGGGGLEPTLGRHQEGGRDRTALGGVGQGPGGGG